MRIGQDFTGLKFNRLSGIRRVKNIGRGLRWLWQCECGAQTIADPSKVKSGHTQSCGCVWVEKCRKHGHGHDYNGNQTRTYKAWVNMRSRVSGRYKQYDNSYTSKGITVCDRWLNSFENFLSDMEECPSGMTLDRFPDNDGNYEPENCRWATPAQQNRNMSRTQTVFFRGETICLVDICKKIGIHIATVRHRLNIGMSVEDALTIPPRYRTRRKTPLRTLVLDYGSEWMMY